MAVADARIADGKTFQAELIDHAAGGGTSGILKNASRAFLIQRLAGPAFLGPAALNRAWTLVNDPRDVAQGERLRAVAGDAGCHSCHTQGSCGERCPKRIEPTAGIAGLKRLAARAAIRGAL